MTLTDLRYLVALARERHFGRAAEKCHVSQPTLSVAVKKVEEELGVQLFERSASEVKITETGRRIVVQAEKVLMEATQIHEIAAAGKDPLAGPLRVGVIYTIGPYLLPRLIPRVHELAPRMPLIIHENYTARLVEVLKRGELDVIIISLPLEEAGVVAQPVYDEPFRVLMPAAHAWTQGAQVDAQQLAEDQLLLLGAGNCFRDQVLEVCPACRNLGVLQVVGLDVDPQLADDLRAWQWRRAHHGSQCGAGCEGLHEGCVGGALLCRCCGLVRSGLCRSFFCSCHVGFFLFGHQSSPEKSCFPTGQPMLL